MNFDTNSAAPVFEESTDTMTAIAEIMRQEKATSAGDSLADTSENRCKSNVAPIQEEAISLVQKEAPVTKTRKKTRWWRKLVNRMSLPLRCEVFKKNTSRRSRQLAISDIAAAEESRWVSMAEPAERFEHAVSCSSKQPEHVGRARLATNADDDLPVTGTSPNENPEAGGHGEQYTEPADGWDEQNADPDKIIYGQKYSSSFVDDLMDRNLEKWESYSSERSTERYCDCRVYHYKAKFCKSRPRKHKLFRLIKKKCNLWKSQLFDACCNLTGVDHRHRYPKADSLGGPDLDSDDGDEEQYAEWIDGCDEQYAEPGVDYENDELECSWDGWHPSSVDDSNSCSCGHCDWNEHIHKKTKAKPKWRINHLFRRIKEKYDWWMSQMFAVYFSLAIIYYSYRYPKAGSFGEQESNQTMDATCYTSTDR